MAGISKSASISELRSAVNECLTGVGSKLQNQGGIVFSTSSAFDFVAQLAIIATTSNDPFTNYTASLDSTANQLPQGCYGGFILSSPSQTFDPTATWSIEELYADYTKDNGHLVYLINPQEVAVAGNTATNSLVHAFPLGISLLGRPIYTFSHTPLPTGQYEGMVYGAGTDNQSSFFFTPIVSLPQS